jgi:hypothetical protein
LDATIYNNNNYFVDAICDHADAHENFISVLPLWHPFFRPDLLQPLQPLPLQQGPWVLHLNLLRPHLKCGNQSNYHLLKLCTILISTRKLIKQLFRLCEG